MGLALASITSIWRWGQDLKLRYIRQHAVPLGALVFQEQEQGPRVAETALAEEGQGFAGLEQGTGPEAALGPATPGEGQPGRQEPVLRLGQGGAVLACLPGVGIYYTELLTGKPSTAMLCFRQISSANGRDS